MRASDFARWAGPRAAHIQNVVTAVTTVTCRQESSVPAVIKPGSAVTTATEVLVTAVTETEPAFTSVSPAAICAAAQLAEGHSGDPCASGGDQGDRGFEPPSTVRAEASTAGSPRRPWHSARGRSKFLVAIETDRLPASISKACAG